MDKGAPAATQVADRFDLVQNLAETLEKVLSSYGNELKAIEQQQRQTSVPTGTVVVTPRPIGTLTEKSSVLQRSCSRSIKTTSEGKSVVLIVIAAH
jgi:hypothetical protein